MMINFENVLTVNWIPKWEGKKFESYKCREKLKISQCISSCMISSTTKRDLIWIATKESFQLLLGLVLIREVFSCSTNVIHAYKPS